MSRKVILYIATSLDGYIAKPGDDLRFLSIVERKDEDYGYTDFITNIDTVILGRRTYDWILKNSQFPYPDKITYIITRSKQPDDFRKIFYTGKLKYLITHLKQEEGKDIFCVGGAQIVYELLKESLIDEFIISVIPVLVGGGILLFREGLPEQKLEFVSVRTYETGLVQLRYRKAD